MSNRYRLVRWLVMSLPVLAVPSAGSAGDPCTPCAPPAAPCAPAPPPPSAAPAPKIVVHVPPPEVVFEGGTCAAAAREKPLRRRLCQRCTPTVNQAPAPLVANVVSPVTTTHTISSLGLNLGATNLALGGLGLGATNLSTAGLGLVSAAPNLPLLANTAGLQTGQVEQAGAFEGLRAVHAAEVRAAAIMAARAQQDAELRSTMAALERARTNMAAIPSCDGKADATSKDLVAATTATVATTTALAKQIDLLQGRLSLLEKEINDVRTIQEAVVRKVTGQPQPGQPSK